MLKTFKTILASIGLLHCSFCMSQEKPDAPASFGYKISWLAIKSSSSHEVAKALRLKSVQESSWANGINAAYRGEVFVSPLIKNWILVVSTSLPDAGGGPASDKATSFLSILSKQFPEVQYFGSNRVVEYHAWAKYRNGTATRRYAYLGERGEVLWNQGPRTKEEIELGFAFDPDKNSLPDEESVMKVAGAWSINPQSLDSLGLPPSLGLVGTLSK